MTHKIFIAGGHYTPAKAVVDELIKKGNWQIYYIGRKHALEGDPALSLEFQEMSIHPHIHFLALTTGRPQRKLTSRTLPGLAKIPVGLAQSLYLMAKFHPDIVLTFGGYLAVPLATAAKLFGIPVLNHEQVPAFDYPSKYLARISRKVLVSFPHLIPKDNRGKWVLTGNPVRQSIFHARLSPEITSLKKLKQTLKQPLIYITGGNQGSHQINVYVRDNLIPLLTKAIIIWQTGDSQQFADFDKINQEVAKLSDKLRQKILVKKFIHEEEIGAVFSLADLIIGRSGANTVSELKSLGLPAILIPIPWVHDAEQEKNARVLADAGAAMILSQNSLTSETFAMSVQQFLNNLNSYKSAALALKDSSSTTAAAKIVAEVEQQLTRH